MRMIRKKILLIIGGLCVFSLNACNENISLEAEGFQQESEQSMSTKQLEDKFPLQESILEESDEMIEVSIIVGNKTFSAKFYNNESVKAITAQMPFILDMRDFLGQEKVAPLSFDLPDSNTQIPSEISIGEIYLWSGNQMVLFYTSISSNSYSYIPVGYIEDIEGLTQALGNDGVLIAFLLE